MSRICAAENVLLKLKVFQKEKLKYAWAGYDLYGLIRFRIKTLLVAVLLPVFHPSPRYLCWAEPQL